MGSSPLIEMLEEALRVLTPLDAFNKFFWVPSTRVPNPRPRSPPRHIDELAWAPHGASVGLGMFPSTGFRRPIEVRATQSVLTRYHQHQS
jgi:hypothetical protein